MNPKQKKTNPNFDAKELIEPMIFTTDEGMPLIDPMVFYERPLDMSQPLPPVKPLSFEYFINWGKVDEQAGERVLPWDYLQQSALASNILVDQPEIPAETSVVLVQDLTSKTDSAAVTEVTQTMHELGDEEKPYAIMRKFISSVNIIVVNEKFYVHSGRSYVPKTVAEIRRMIMRVCRENMPNKSSSLVKGVADFLLQEPDIYVADSDIPKHLVAFQNCVLDIQNGVVLPPSPRYYTLYEINANYTPDRPIYTPTFDAFLESITGSDPELVERIWQLIGYTLTPDTRAKCFFLFQGVGNSGKSVLSNLIQKLFSDNAVMQLDIRSFNDKFATSNLVGKALCSSPDLPSVPLDERTVSKLKQLTGNDPVSSDVKFTNHVKFVCNAKLIFSTNHAILTKSRDDAFFYRACTVPFKYAISREKQDFDLDNKLFKERDGIVTKAIAAYFRLVANGYFFAGEFRVNEVLASDVPSDLDYRVRLYEFVTNRFRKDELGRVFIEDAFNAFSVDAGGIPLGEFSSNFQRFAAEIYGAKKTRKRRPGAVNPISCVEGISFVEDDLEGAQ